MNARRVLCKSRKPTVIPFKTNSLLFLFSIDVGFVGDVLPGHVYHFHLLVPLLKTIKRNFFKYVFLFNKSQFYFVIVRDVKLVRCNNKLRGMRMYT